MEEASEEQLGAMGLSIRPPNLDITPEFDDWTNKATYHDKIKGNTSQPMMPTSLVMWRKENGTNDMSGIRCEAGNHIAKINAVIVGGGVGGANITLPDEYFLCKEETGKWSEKHLTPAFGNLPKN